MSEETNYAEKISALLGSVGGCIQLKKPWWKFWKPTVYLWIEREDQGKTFWVQIASGETTHQPLTFPSVGCDIDRDTGKFKDAWKTALSLWRVNDPDHKREIIHRMKRFIDRAYEENISCPTSTTS